MPAAPSKPVLRSKRPLGSGVAAGGDASNARVVLPFELVERAKVPSVGVKSVESPRTSSVTTPMPATASFGKPSELFYP
jgi:hypothetical protein